MTGTVGDDKCKRIGELVVWLPTGTLDAEERAEVEAHVAGCPACADLMKFASTLRGALVERYSPHPSAETLVCFAEDRAGMDPQVRSRVEDHLSACPDCREEVAMLEAIDRGDSEAVSQAEALGRRPAEPGTLVSGLRRFWDSLRGSILRPIPAAVYLMLAVVAIGLYIAGPARKPEAIPGRGDQRTGVLSGPAGISGSVGGIVILADETTSMRQAGGQEVQATEIDADEVQFLLLELTGLKTPPADEASYTVKLLKEGSPAPVAEAGVRGRDFRDNYTLCFALERSGLMPGAYTVMVDDPQGNTVFRSSIIAR